MTQKSSNCCNNWNFFYKKITNGGRNLSFYLGYLILIL